MTGILGFGARNRSGSVNHTRRLDKITVGGRLRMPERRAVPLHPPPFVDSPARQVSARCEGQIQLGMTILLSVVAGDQTTYKFVVAGEHSHSHNLADITNTYNAPGLPTDSNNHVNQSSQQIVSSHHGKSAVSTIPSTTSVNSQDAGYFSSQPANNAHNGSKMISNIPPSTPVNNQGADHFSTPSSRIRNHSRAEASNTNGTQHRTQHHSTSSSKHKNHGRVETDSYHDKKHQSTPSRKDKNQNRSEIRVVSDEQHSTSSNRAGSQNRAEANNGTSETGGNLPKDFYRSGRENTISGMSTSTTGTSILGRDISGMSAAMERRHAKIDQRITAAD